MQHEEETKNERATKSDTADHDPYYARNPRANRSNEVSVVNRERGLGVYYNLGSNTPPIRSNKLFRM